MEGRLVLKDCSIFRSDGRVRTRMAIVIEGDVITQIADDATVQVLPGDWEVRCRGRLVMAGLIDCHTRLVGGLVAPWTGDSLLKPFHARKKDEHDIEAHITPGEVEAITAFAMARGLRAGTSMFVEHLYAPHCVNEALSAQARAAMRVGGRLINSHASASAFETEKFLGPAQVDENARYAEQMRKHECVRGLVGVAASSLANDDLLRRAGKVKEELGVGSHFPLGVSDDDLAMTWSKHNTRIVNRFELFGLLGATSVAAHARAIDRHEAERLARLKTLIALCPRTTFTQEGGTALGMEAVLVSQNLVGLGTNGRSSLWEEIAASFAAVMALARTGRMLDPDSMLSGFLAGGAAELCTMIFGRPSGSVDIGALADLVVLDHLPAADSFGIAPGALVGLGTSQVAWNIVNGRVVVREGQLVAGDFLELAREARLALESLWNRTSQPPPPVA